MSDVVGQLQDLIGGEEHHLVPPPAGHAQRVGRVAPDRIGSERLLQDEAQHLAGFADRPRRQADPEEAIDEALAVPVGDRGDRPVAEHRKRVDPQGGLVANQCFGLQVQAAQPLRRPFGEQPSREALVEQFAAYVVGLDRGQPRAGLGLGGEGLRRSHSFAGSVFVVAGLEAAGGETADAAVRASSHWVPSSCRVRPATSIRLRTA